MHEEGTGSYAVPSSVKVVVLADMGPGAEVLLGLNDRGSGEVPGGLSDTQDETLADTVAREAFEGSGIVIDNDLVLVGVEFFTPVPERQVTLVRRAARLGTFEPPPLSPEHKNARWVDVETLASNPPSLRGQDHGNGYRDSCFSRVNRT